LVRVARQSFLDSDRTHGSLRVWRDLLAAGEPCGLHRVERLMKTQTLRAAPPRRRGLPVDRGELPLAAPDGDVLDRQFEAAVPNQKWVADFTCRWKAEGWFYVAVVVVLYSRSAVGWSTQTSMTLQLVTDALMMAILRLGKPEAVLHHSDRGSQYTSERPEKRTEPEAKPRATCSITSSTSTTPSACTRPSVTSARHSSRNRWC
jgi:putative transposase